MLLNSFHSTLKQNTFLLCLLIILLSMSSEMNILFHVTTDDTAAICKASCKMCLKFVKCSLCCTSGELMCKDDISVHDLCDGTLFR